MPLNDPELASNQSSPIATLAKTSLEIKNSSFAAAAAEEEVSEAEMRDEDEADVVR